ncbi:MAG: hypothetical protein ABH803_02075 [Candidatus Micrarchaeota archaeon]
MSKKEKEEIPLTYIVAAFLILAIGITAVLFYNPLQPTQPTPLPTQKPVLPELTITAITMVGCQACFDLNDVITELNKISLVKEVKQVEYNSPEGQKLILDYGVKKLPSMIISGEINNPKINYYVKTLGFEKNNSIVLDLKKPIYFDLEKQQFIGEAKLIRIDTSDCFVCSDTNQLLNALDENGVRFLQQESYEYNDTKAKELIEKYNITAVPTLIIQLNPVDYPNFPELWKQVGSQEENNTFVLRKVNPIFKDPLTGKEQGITELIYLLPENCSECYDVRIHQPFLEEYDVRIGTINSFNQSSSRGKQLINAYNITKLPTVILSPDAKYYEKLNDVWGQLGLITNDGAYVFTNMNALSSVTYLDLETGEKVKTEK